MLGTPQRRRFAYGGGATVPGAPTAPTAPSPTGGFMPTTTTVSNDLGISPIAGKLATTLLGLAVPPLGLALTGYNTLANINNTANNAGMLGQAGDPQGLGQVLGGVLGLNSLAGSPAGALNGAEDTAAGRAALNAQSQVGGELPGVSLPTQTAPVTPVTSQSLAAPPGMGGGAGSTSGGDSTGTTGNPGVGEGGAGVAGNAGFARGGAARSKPKRASVVIVMAPLSMPPPRGALSQGRSR